MQRLDKDSHLPIYIQIKNIILAEIRSGSIKPEEQIPSEADLAKLNGVSRLTARSAVTQLVDEGHLVRIRGQGTFVSRPRVESSASSSNDFLTDMTRKGYAVKTELLSAREMPAAASIQDALLLSPGESLFCLRRRRWVNNEAIVVLESYIPTGICAGLLDKDFEKRSLYEILKTDYALVLTEARERLEALVADEQLADELRVQRGAALLFSTRKAMLASGRPVEFTKCWYRGDRYAFDVHIRIDDRNR